MDANDGDLNKDVEDALDSLRIALDQAQSPDEDIGSSGDERRPVLRDENLVLVLHSVQLHDDSNECHVISHKASISRESSDYRPRREDQPLNTAQYPRNSVTLTCDITPTLTSPAIDYTDAALLKAASAYKLASMDGKGVRSASLETARHGDGAGDDGNEYLSTRTSSPGSTRVISVRGRSSEQVFSKMSTPVLNRSNSSASLDSGNGSGVPTKSNSRTVHRNPSDLQTKRSPNGSIRSQNGSHATDINEMYSTLTTTSGSRKLQTEDVDAQPFRRNALHYATFRQIRLPSTGEVRKQSMDRPRSSVSNSNLLQLSSLPAMSNAVKETESIPASVLKNYTKGRPFVTYWVKHVVRDIKFDGACNLLMSTRSSVLMFDVNGHLMGELFKDNLTEPYGLFVCENNNVLVSDSKRNVVCEFDGMCRLVKTYGPIPAPAGVAKNRNGYVYVCSRCNRMPSCVMVFSPSGEVHRRIGDEHLDNPTSIALSGKLIIVADGTYVVGLDDLEQVQFVYGQAPAAWDELARPPSAAVAVDSDGYVLVTDFTRNSVSALTPDVEQAGLVLGETQECKHPVFLATSRYGHLAVVERHEIGFKVKLYKRNEKALGVRK